MNDSLHCFIQQFISFNINLLNNTIILKTRCELLIDVDPTFRVAHEALLEWTIGENRTFAVPVE